MVEGIERFAPAKVNLFLHVGTPAPDGYHPVSSLMVFADVGDVVRLTPAAAMDFALEGPFAGVLDAEGGAEGGGNLVVRARELILARLSAAATPFRLILDKQLPVAAGLGGGSADAAAALALIQERLDGHGLSASRVEVLMNLARELGSDVAACLESIPVIATGRGDVLRPAPPMPPLDAVLVNPLAPSATGAVYRAYDRVGAPGGADMPALPTRFATAAEVVAFLTATRNDLQAPAIGLQPLISDVLDLLAASPESRLARMSGSGATCFALCADRGAAERLAAHVAEARPAWWTRACRLGAGAEGKTVGVFTTA